MPRPIFGAADWWTFEELDDPKRFPPIGRHADDSDTFETITAKAADDLAQELVGDDKDISALDGSEGLGAPTWPGFEFCVSRGTKTVLMVRRRT